MVDLIQLKKLGSWKLFLNKPNLSKSCYATVQLLLLTGKASSHLYAEFLLTSHCALLRKLGMLQESKNMLKDALNTYMKMFGEESSAVALVLNNLGGTYSMMELFRKSRFANPIITQFVVATGFL